MHSRITFYVYAKIGQVNGGAPLPESATAGNSKYMYTVESCPVCVCACKKHRRVWSGLLIRRLDVSNVHTNAVLSAYCTHIFLF